MTTNDPSKGSPKTPWTIYVIFSFLALFAALGLDYINWTRGEKSLVFSNLIGAKEVEKPEIPLLRVVLSRISMEGIPGESISRFKDPTGTVHLKIDVSLPEYASIEPLLRQDFQMANATIAKVEEQGDDERKYFLWEIARLEKEKIAVLFSCRKEIPKVPEKPPRVEPANKVALIMDDMGYSLDAIYDILSLEEPITVAIIPFSPLGIQTARLAHQNNLEILLHLPLESINSAEAYNGIEGMIHTGMSEQEIIAVLERDLDEIPHISGVNNHMGSKVTPNEAIMNIILDRLKRRDLFFVDSRTTGDTVAYDLARLLGIPAAQRQVFLDNEADETLIKDKLIELFTLAQRTGEAIGICHPLPETIRVLKNYFQLAETFDAKPVFVSELLR
jgi:polysaccharide deacetylase 2 family uncharacterized protein YibQ